jgi:hypothetical protein
MSGNNDCNDSSDCSDSINTAHITNLQNGVSFSDKYLVRIFVCSFGKV